MHYHASGHPGSSMGHYAFDRMHEPEVNVFRKRKGKNVSEEGNWSSPGAPWEGIYSYGMMTMRAT